MRVLAVLLVLPGVAMAGSVTVRNGAGEAVAGIHMAPAGSGSVGENRMRSTLPPGAEARITYSTGCRADVRIAYASGRTEDHPGVDTCGDQRITAGTDGVAGPVGTPVARSAGLTQPASSGRPGPGGPAKIGPVKAPPPEVPPWTGRSITRPFGGLQ